jgi:hypothetical protein
MKRSPHYGCRSIAMGHNNGDELIQLTIYRKAALAWCPILKLFDVINSIVRKYIARRIHLCWNEGELLARASSRLLWSFQAVSHLLANVQYETLPHWGRVSNSGRRPYFRTSLTLPLIRPGPYGRVISFGERRTKSASGFQFHRKLKFHSRRWEALVGWPGNESSAPPE